MTTDLRYCPECQRYVADQFAHWCPPREIDDRVGADPAWAEDRDDPSMKGDQL